MSWLSRLFRKEAQEVQVEQEFKQELDRTRQQRSELNRITARYRIASGRSIEPSAQEAAVAAGTTTSPPPDHQS